MANINQTIKKAKNLLQKADNPTASLDAEVLLAYVLNKNREFLLLHPSSEISPEEELIFEELTKRRLHNEPIAHIIGKKEFWGLDFIVNKHTLIPRPESETLIELALKLFPNTKDQLQIVDIGTGTGCLAISLLTEFPNSTAIALDINNDAIKIAKQNREEHNLTNKLQLLQSNLFKNISPDSHFDLIISNPPYIPFSTQLEPNVANFEPHNALFAQENGLYFYKQIAQLSPAFLKPNGIIIVEIGINQSKEVIQIFKSQGLSLIEVRKDLLGIERAIAFGKPN